MPAVEVESLVVRYGDLVAVDGVSFNAEGGQVTAVLGPNGAGKTSTVSVLEGYLAPDGGRARVLGLDPIADHRELVRRMGAMPQGGALPPGIRVREAARWFCDLYGSQRQAPELLEQVGLTARAAASWRQLSGGEQQRLSLALALAGTPEVIFLDEPTASVDVAGRQQLRSLIRELADGGCCVVLTTHELDEAERVADHVVIIDRGRLVADGTLAELKSGFGAAATIHFGAPAGLDIAALASALGAAVRESTPGEYVVAQAPTPASVAALTAWLAEHDLPLADLRAGRQRLEDVFVRLTSPPDGSGEPADRQGRAASS